MIVRPILLTYETLPSMDYVDPFNNALTGPNGAEKFFDAYGMPTDFVPVQRFAYSGADYRHLDNPWHVLYPFVTPLLEPGEKALVVLTDWVEQSAYGWGGSPLALVGKYAANRLLTFGSPEHLVDDFHAMGLMAHEVAHTMGFGHNYTNPNIMNADLYNWPNTHPSPEMVNLALGLAAAPLSRLTMFLDSKCPRPPEVT